jgi:hypothetical protein
MSRPLLLIARNMKDGRRDGSSVTMEGGAKMTRDTAKQENSRLQLRICYLEGRLAQYEPESAVRICDLLHGSERKLSPDVIQSEVLRLVVVCAEIGVSAVVPKVCTCRELLERLAEACHKSGLTSAGQYLTYLATPW